jgi:Myb-like DNA-binding domain
MGGGGHAPSSNIHSSSTNINNKDKQHAASTKRGGTSREWSKREDDLLKQLVEAKGTKNWADIVTQLPGRKESTCQRRWNKVIKPSIIKGPWTQDEDEKLLTLIAKHGAKRWSVTAQELPGRSGKQCRERWHNHLNPSIVKDKTWTLDEDVAILHHQSKMGNKWSEMQKFLPGRYVHTSTTSS